MSDEMNPTSEGIEVDDAAAYFGATESSDVLHAMMAMPREQAMVQFFEILSDIVLRPGEFDFEAASERMQCEGGEIYYLVAGHLGLMSMPDPLLQALGMPDSSGETATGTAAVSEQQRSSLEALSDPMRMMKLFAVAFQTGGNDEVLNYMNRFQSMLNNIEGSLDALVSINNELDAALDLAGHVLPIATLASGAASAATVDVPETTVLPAAPAEPTAPAAPPEPSVPLPGGAPAESSSPEPVPSPSVALPTAAVALPERSTEAVPEQGLNIESEKQVAKATQDAFSGAFSSQLVPEAEPSESVEPEANETVVSAEDETEFVSAAEHFIAADEDGSGALDVEELAQATGTSIEEATALHAEADTDGDGVVTLSEFISSPAAEKTAALPKPVAPVRRPLGQRQAAQPTAPVQQPPAPVAQPPAQPTQPWQQAPPQQSWPQQQPPRQSWPQQQPPQQGWPQQRPNQPQAPLVQPTIRSGVHCRNCGIGLDPYWRFCPVCGAQNMGY
jgi:hypothetical protein